MDDINFDLEPSDSVHQYGSNRGNRAQSGGVGRFGHRAEPPQELRRSFVTQQVAMFDEVEDLDRKPPPAIGLRAGPPAVPGPQNHNSDDWFAATTSVAQWHWKWQLE